MSNKNPWRVLLVTNSVILLVPDSCHKTLYIPAVCSLLKEQTE